MKSIHYKVLLCSILILFALSWSFVHLFFKEGDSRKGSGSTNSTADYLQSYSDLMRSYMNLSVDPCDDFYEYACGNYRNMKQDRHSLEMRVNLNDIKYLLADITSQLLGRTDLAETLNVSGELEVAQGFYNACLGANLYPFPARDPAYLSLIRSIGGFPAVDGVAWNASNFSWFNMSAHLTNYGAKGLIREEISLIYPFNPAIYKMPELGFDSIVLPDNIASNNSRTYQVNEERMRGYLRSLDLPEDKIADVIEGIFAFWLEVLEVTPKNDDPKGNLSFDVTNYFEIAWNRHMNDSDNNNRYFKEIDKVCARHPEAVANYLAMQLLFTFDAKLEATKYQRDYCGSMLQTSMAFLFNKLYMTEYFTNKKRLEVSEMVEELRKSIRLDSEAPQKVLSEESTLKSIIGSTEDKWLTDRLIREIRRLEIIEDSFAATNININRLNVDINRFSTRHAKELSEHSQSQILLLGMQVQAFYNILDHSINILAGIMHPPAYHPSWPLSLKFGTLGYVIGHELTHSIQTMDSSWEWFSKANISPKVGKQCFAKHYNNYVIPEIDRHIDGEKTVNENIADYGGLRYAMAAYRSHMKQLLEDRGQEKISEQMPGLDLLPEQLFFLGSAQLFCSVYKEEQYWDQLQDVHTVEKYRVLGALSNNEDFFQAFGCPVESGMRTENQTCRQW